MMRRRTTTKAAALASLSLVAGVAQAQPAPVADPAPVAEAPPTAPAGTAEASSATSASPAAASAAAADDASSASDGETIEVVDRAPPGARTELSAEVLERDEHDDLHKVLRQVAGVYLRDEDGFGLRPNIGMRGAASDRSAKITIMEDGVLSGPAPYSAPAAYYVPLITRMSRVEVTKGPSAIRFGPATVGGAIDLISAPMPGERSAYLDVAGGSDRYGKLHARVAERRERWGVMAEYVRLQTEGFKELDGGGDTGFDKDDVQLTARYQSPPAATLYHQLDARLGYGHETSNETYTGLTDADFARNPQRRYAGSQLDQMNWNHWTMRATHRLELGAHTRIATTAYRHWFHRKWGKVDAFVGQRDLLALLTRPSAGANAVYYAILTGQADSSSPEEQLLLGTNDRSFISQGVQSALSAERSTGVLRHHLEAGVRLHWDQADRRRYEDGYDMRSGQLRRSERPRATVLDSLTNTLAVAGYAEDRILYQRYELSAGLRVEHIAYDFADQLGDRGRDSSYTVLIPGGGLVVHLTDSLSALAGVHRGFVPVAPSASSDVRPESSVNYEAGVRLRTAEVSADAIGFFSDYSNLKGSCTLASGCTEAMDGQEYNGGHVRVWGAELQATSELPLSGCLLGSTGWSVPLALAYTFTRSSFASSFSSDFAGWGEVAEGDELPYLPAHLLSATAGVRHPRWDLSVTATYHGASRDLPGQGDIPDGARLASLLTFDASAHARLRDWAELYVTATNLLDEQVIVSRRPYAARPNSPRLLTAGLKAHF